MRFFRCSWIVSEATNPGTIQVEFRLGSRFTRPWCMPISTGRLVPCVVPSNTSSQLPSFIAGSHTSTDEGGETNFAGTFPLWDGMFGTFRMPQGELPVSYGIDDPEFPNQIAGQLVYPFQK